jgi:hypothetical protein
MTVSTSGLNMPRPVELAIDRFGGAAGCGENFLFRTTIRDSLRCLRKFLDAPKPRGRVSNPPLRFPILFLRPLRSLRPFFFSVAASLP